MEKVEVRTDMSHLLNAIEASFGLFATCSDQLRPNERGAVLQKTESY